MNHEMSMSVVPAPAWLVAQEPLDFEHWGGGVILDMEAAVTGEGYLVWEQE